MPTGRFRLKKKAEETEKVGSLGGAGGASRGFWGGAEHPDILAARFLPYLVLSSQDEREESLREAETTYEGRRKALGDTHSDTPQAKALIRDLKGE